MPRSTPIGSRWWNDIVSTWCGARHDWRLNARTRRRRSPDLAGPRPQAGRQRDDRQQQRPTGRRVEPERLPATVRRNQPVILALITPSFGRVEDPVGQEQRDERRRALGEREAD